VRPELVGRMEDLLDLYAAPDEPRYPVVCFAESPYQRISAVRQPLPMGPGQPRRYDDDDRREGTCHVCMFFQPWQGWRHVKVTDRRTAQDCAHGLKAWVDMQCPEATLSSVVMAHLHTHTPAAVYEACTPAEARRLLRQLDLRSTPKHGSWRNMAAREFAGRSPQGVDQRLPSQAAVCRTVAAWETRRNVEPRQVTWRFTIAKARRTLKRFYPSSSSWWTTRGCLESCIRGVEWLQHMIHPALARRDAHVSPASGLHDGPDR
jgi:DDE superfamily endonuclease